MDLTPMGLTPTPGTIPRIGIFGGTFDPIHIGHLAIVRWAQAELRLSSVRVIPTGQSWQKARAGANAQQRVEMLKLALAGDPFAEIDEREVRRSGPSYTVETLESLRSELGTELAMVLILGSDQLHNLASWHRYDEILQLAHIGVTQREDVRLSNFPPAVEALLKAHGSDSLPNRAAGTIVFFRMPMVPVSATVLRQQIGAGQSPVELVPGAVLDYINQHKIYRTQ